MTISSDAREHAYLSSAQPTLRGASSVRGQVVILPVNAVCRARFVRVVSLDLRAGSY